MITLPDFHWSSNICTSSQQSDRRNNTSVVTGSQVSCNPCVTCIARENSLWLPLQSLPRTTRSQASFILRPSSTLFDSRVTSCLTSSEWPSQARRRAEWVLKIILYSPTSVGSTKNNMHRNKSAQSNLGRGPRGALSHIYAVKSSLVTITCPKFALKSTPSHGPIPKSNYLPNPWTCPTYGAKRYPDPIRRFSTMYWDISMHARTHMQTDRSSMEKFDDYRPLCYESDAA